MTEYKGPQGGRNDWIEADITALTNNDRVLATLLFLFIEGSTTAEGIKTQSRVAYLDETLEIILGRPERSEDYASGVYAPLSDELSYHGIRRAVVELTARYMDGRFSIDPAVLSRYPDIESYIPKIERERR